MAAIPSYVFGYTTRAHKQPHKDENTIVTAVCDAILCINCHGQQYKSTAYS